MKCPICGKDWTGDCEHYSEHLIKEIEDLKKEIERLKSINHEGNCLSCEHYLHYDGEHICKKVKERESRNIFFSPRYDGIDCKFYKPDNLVLEGST